MAGLVFILHDAPNGRTGARNRALIGAHTLKHNRRLKCQTRSPNHGPIRTTTLTARRKLLGRPKRKPETYFQGVEGETQSCAAGTSKQAIDGASLHVNSVLDESLGLAAVPTGPIICGADREDIQSIGQWYFLNQLHEAHVSYFHHAQNHWTNGLWEMALVNRPMFASAMALASYREVALAKRCSASSYIELKGRAISLVGKELSTRNANKDPLTMVAIALLAYLDMRETHFGAARLHLLALCNLVNITEMPSYAWLYCVWIDLRYALLTSQLPMLPYHIPTSFRQASSCWVPVNLRTSQRASSNVANCPQTRFLNHHKAFDLFNKLHALCLCSGQLENSNSPPFGQIYDLEYDLRVMQSRIFNHEFERHNTAAVELVILAAQLHIWMACRFWTPQRRESHLACVTRASSILNAFSDIVIRWDGLASADSLLWILFTMVAMVRIYGSVDQIRMLDLLHSTLTTLGIYCHEEFSSKLAEWPWIDDWHHVQTVHVWAMLTERFDDLAVLVPNAYAITVPMIPTRLPQRLFLGGLEFFNSL